MNVCKIVLMISISSSTATDVKPNIYFSFFGVQKKMLFTKISYQLNVIENSFYYLNCIDEKFSIFLYDTISTQNLTQKNIVFFEKDTGMSYEFILGIIYHNKTSKLAYKFNISTMLNKKISLCVKKYEKHENLHGMITLLNFTHMDDHENPKLTVSIYSRIDAQFKMCVGLNSTAQAVCKDELGDSKYDQNIFLIVLLIAVLLNGILFLVQVRVEFIRDLS